MTQQAATPTFEQALGEDGPAIVECALKIVSVMESYDVDTRYSAYDLASSMASKRQSVRRNNDGAARGLEGCKATAIPAL